MKHLTLSLVIQTATSFRGLSAILKLEMDSGFINAKRMPSHTTLRRWLNQYGYFKLTSIKDKADDWIYIIDNSIRAENRKVCLILGVRSSQLKKGSYISFKDVEVIELQLISKNREVLPIIEKAIAKTNLPMQIISDEGPDIIPSVRQIQNKYPSVAHVPDMMHKVGNMLKKKLANDKRWEIFVTELTQAKNRLKQTEFSYMSPPNLNMKARFLNSLGAVQWAFVTIETLKKSKNLDPILIEKLEWLLPLESNIRLFLELFELAQASKEIARKLHIEKDGWLIAKQALGAIAKSKEGKQFAKNVIEFIKIQCDKAVKGLMLGSSEIIESAFSKLKILDRECGNGGFTTSIVGLAACFGKFDEESVRNSFKNHIYREVEEYGEKYVGETIVKKRKIFYSLRRNRSKKLAMKVTRIIEEKIYAA